MSANAVDEKFAKNNGLKQGVGLLGHSGLS